MSFDLILQAFEKGKEGKGNREKALNFLSGFSCSQPDEFGYFTVSHSDGFEIEVAAKGLLNEEQAYSGAAFFLHGLSDETVAFIYDLAEYSGFVILNLQAGEGEPVVILPKGINKNDLPKEDYFLENMQAEIHSGIELGFLLRDGMDRWQAYREQILSGP